MTVCDLRVTVRLTVKGSEKTEIPGERKLSAYLQVSKKSAHLAYLIFTLLLLLSPSVSLFLVLFLTERIFEDHENLVENLLNWTRDSHNKLMFVERIEKYALFKNPQVTVQIISSIAACVATLNLACKR